MASHLSVTNGLPSPRTPAGPTSLYLGAAQASRRVRDPLVGHVERGWCERGHVERGWCVGRGSCIKKVCNVVRGGAIC